MKGDLTVRLDEHDVELKLTASTFPEPAELRTGLGIIQLEFAMTPSPLAVGAHRLAVENRHFPNVSVYLFNAAKPKSGLIEITSQKRNQNQSAGEIGFTLNPPSSASR